MSGDLSPLGLNVDMFDVDLLKHLAEAGIQRDKLRDLAARLEKEIRDVGELRKQAREQQEAGYGHGV